MVGVRRLVIFSTLFSCLGVLFSTIICKSYLASNKSILSEFLWLMHENSLASSTMGSIFSAHVICLRDNRRWRDNPNSHHDDVYRTYIASESIVGDPLTDQIQPSRRSTQFGSGAGTDLCQNRILQLHKCILGSLQRRWLRNWFCIIESPCLVAERSLGPMLHSRSLPCYSNPQWTGQGWGEC